MNASTVQRIQQQLAAQDLDGWLFYVFQHNDPIALDLLGLGGRHITRRCYYLVPREGTPQKLDHRLEPWMLDHLPGEKELYLTWREHAAGLERLVAGRRRLAVQYSPENGIPTVSRLDAGTAELLRGRGIELVSSAELAQQFAALWTPDQLASHRRANAALHEIVHAAFGEVRSALREGRAITEFEVQSFIRRGFERHGLETDAGPNVSVNAHSADPHYEPTADASATIRRGDFLLIDLWAREARPDAIFGDITWCAVASESPTDRQRQVWETAVRARDAAWQLVSSRFPRETVRGFEVDDAARAVIEAAGWGEQFYHRTGHSIGTSTHGQGANMDNLETHDTRPLLPMTGFSIEPGIYFEGEFGVRTEIDVALTEEGAEITGGEPQKELVRLV